MNICNNRSAERTVKRKMRLPALLINPRGSSRNRGAWWMVVALFQARIALGEARLKGIRERLRKVQPSVRSRSVPDAQT